MTKRKLLITAILILGAGVLALPTVLRAIPSRYVVRWVPEPLQALALPQDQTPLLPTVAVTADLSDLLQGNSDATPAAASQTDPPATVTPLPTSAAIGATPRSLPPTFTPPPSPPPTETAVPLPTVHRLRGFTHQFQEWNNCGPATLAMTLSYFDLTVGQSQAAAVLKPNPEDRNVSPDEMAAYVNDETNLHAIFRANGNMDTVRRLVANDIPVVLEIGIDPPGEYSWMGWYGHYLLVVAYDDTQQQFSVYDSWFGTSEVPLENATSDGRILTYADVRQYWPHFNRNYIAVYRPEQAALVAEIIGAEMNDSVMWQNALTQVRAETSAAPNNAFNWFNLGTVYNALGQYAEAASAFDQARAIGLPWRMLWYQFGPYEAYHQVGRYEDVILLADATLKNRPYFEESFYYKGMAHLAQGDTRAARQNLEKAASFNPNFRPAAIALAELNS